MPAAEPEVADAADPSAPSAHKSILKKAPSARAPNPTEEHEDEDHFAIFNNENAALLYQHYLQTALDNGVPEIQEH